MNKERRIDERMPTNLPAKWDDLSGGHKHSLRILVSVPRPKKGEAQIRDEDNVCPVRSDFCQNFRLYVERCIPDFQRLFLERGCSLESRIAI